MVSRLKKLSVLLLLTSAYSVVMAKGLFDPSANDQSLTFLTRMFGAVGGLDELGPPVVGQQLMGTLLKYFNLGLLSFC